MKLNSVLAALSVGLFVWTGPASAAVDAPAAEALLKAEKCVKCHDAVKSKKGPSFKVTAAKYKAGADAEAALIKRLTAGSDDHEGIATKDAKAVKNLAEWILAQ